MATLQEIRSNALHKRTGFVTS